jgi:DNA (cytosine-5)-methyltransferase 1
VADIQSLTLEKMDEAFGAEFTPSGVIGGPPCQSFTNANRRKRENDPRALLLPRFFDVAMALHRRAPLDFIVMENVPELATKRYRDILDFQLARLKAAGFVCSENVLNAYDYGVAQNRKRLFIVALNKRRFGNLPWSPPTALQRKLTVADAIGDLPPATIFNRSLTPSDISFHENHWCMAPKSKKFGSAQLAPGKSVGRSFKLLDWARPSFTVSYGHREVHIHPDGQRRLSILEAMLLQGFSKDFVLEGNLSQQVTQVSEAVPPPMAAEIARSIVARRVPATPPECNQSVQAARASR